ncbi:PAS domain S-box protein [Azospirillum sp. RWY-5-1]|uniref:histidine kinase n=1 Tax=Azospirillum oleiclasticum TaxID=2735135 RepID=A0ABX2TN72_9PROT|nr:ATP-binding protein [Azospirillum oleiclasticum]NYZ17438.1 PAS domain S-box protein [Azospirillum oleiclasticum]NYZ24815.1 PAS domain S-box protein [Azospirillum oleiclasticum]
MSATHDTIQRSILRHMHGGVFTLDLQGRVTTFNPAAARILGIDEATAPGRLFADLFIGDALNDGFVQAVIDAIYDPQRLHERNVAYHRGGVRRFLKMRVSFLWIGEETGSPVKAGIIALFSDVTEHHESEEALNRLTRELETRVEDATRRIRDQNSELTALNDTKNRLFTIIAHDLRGPFGTLREYLRMLYADQQSADGGPGRSEQSEFLLHALMAADQGFSLLDNLLDWTRLQMDRIVFQPEPVRLKPLVQNALDVQSGAAVQKGVALFNTVGNVAAVIDRAMIGTVVRNLVANAVKFTPAGGRVTVGAGIADEGVVEVSVADTGVGMRPDRLAGLFADGATLSTRGTRGESGTGLGLLLCGDFVKRHGGRLWADSAPGVGSVFRFTVPAA